jgi:hypothetical protein
VKRAVVVALALAVLAGACGKKNEQAPNLNAANKVTNRVARFYFESNDLRLVAESRNLALPESAGAAIPIVARELMKGPSSPSTYRLFPQDTEVRGAWLLPGGLVIVDLGGPTLQEGWQTGSHQELMAIQSLAHTMAANFPEVRRLRVLVNGTPAETLAGHIALSRPFTPDASVISR